MTSITLRSVKGSPLTNNEVDSNFNSLNVYKVELTDSTGSIIVPAGTTAERDDSPVNGYLRYNTETDKLEVYAGGSWSNIGELTSSISYNTSNGTLTLTTSDSSYTTVINLQPFTTTNLTEGDNQYFTTARARNSLVAGSGILYDSATGVISQGESPFDLFDSADFDISFAAKTTDDLTEGSTNLYYDSATTVTVARNSVSVTDAGGDGSLTYNAGTGVITYTGPSASEVRAHISAGTGVSITDGQISIGQAVATTSDVTFAQITGDSAILDAIAFNAQTFPPGGGAIPGTLFWDSDEQKGLSFVTRTREGFVGATINVGQELLVYVHNQTGEQINNGDVVYVSGTAHGLHPSITKAQANVGAPGQFLVATQDIADNAHGYVTKFGLVRDVNTGGLVAGDDIYLSADSAGKWTTTSVTIDNGYPAHIGVVVKVDSSEGTILVDPWNENFEYLRIEDRLKVTGSIEGSTLSLDSSAYFTPIDQLVRPTYLEGTVWYDEDEKGLAFHGPDSEFTHYIDQRDLVRGRNSSGSLIPKGTPVYTDGVHIPGNPVHGHHPLIYPADAADAAKYEVIGITAHDIADGAHGWIVARGWIQGINTAGLVSGDRFHLAPGGGFQSAAPSYPNYPIDLGIALTVDSTGGGGSIYVDINSHTQEQIRITGDGRVDGNWTIGGNLNVVGTTTSTVNQSVTVPSQFIRLVDGNTVGTGFLGTTGAGGLNDATFIGKYLGDSDLYYFVRISAIDSAGGGGDTIEWGISDSATMGYGSLLGGYGYGLGFESDGGQATWKLGVDGTIAPLRNGISIQFINSTGHKDSDEWVANPVEINLDLGLIGNYNPTGPGGLRYTGIFRDVTDSRWKFFEGYDSSIDSSTTIINTSNPGFTLSDVQAGTFYGALSGNASSATTATQLTTGRTFSLTGDITATGVSFDGTGNVQLTTVYNPGSIVNDDINASAAIADTKLATISSSGKVQNSATTATNANTASAIVARDASGNFSAGTITADINRDAFTTVTAGVYGSAALVPVITVDANGFIDSIGEVSVAGVSATTFDSATATYTISTADGGSYATRVYSQELTRTAVSAGTGITYSSSTGVIATNDGAIVHDNLSGFVSNEHIDHSTVSITAGAGLTGGGTIAATRTLNIGAGTGITVNADDIAISNTGVVAATYGDSSTIPRITVNAQGQITAVVGATVNIPPGYGDADVDAHLSGGTGITYSAGVISTNDGQIIHDNLSGFVSDEHVAHSGVTITAGSGLTGGGTIAASRTLNVGAGSYIIVNADDVAVDATSANTASKVVARDASGNFSAGTITATLTGNASTATTLQTARTIGGVSFDGSANINLPGVNTTGNQNTTGNAASATYASAVTLTADNSTDATNYPLFANAATGNLSPRTDTGLTYNPSTGVLTSTTFTGALSGNASTATALQTARTIGGVSFDGTANINLPGVNTTGNQNTTGTAAGITGYSGTYWTSNNDGAGTGLDADLLDGQHGSYYRIDVYNAAGTLLN